MLFGRSIEMLNMSHNVCRPFTLAGVVFTAVDSVRSLCHQLGMRGDMRHQEVPENDFCHLEPLQSWR